MFTRNSIVLSNNIKTPLTSISRAVGNILQLTDGQPVKSLFANGEQGFAYDPNDLTTLYQDAAGTIPVTAAGQAVGLMKDKSGRNNHAFQSVSESRPILQRNATTGAYYLEFDGSDDFLITGSINLTMTDKLTVFAGVRKLQDGVFGTILEHGNNTDSDGSFALICAANKGYYMQCGGIGNRSLVAASGGAGAPRIDVVAVQMDRSKTDVSELKYGINANTLTSNSVSLEGSGATGSFINLPAYIGCRSGTIHPFNGHLYSLIGIGRLTTDSETIALEKAIAKNVGVTLNV